MDPLQLPPPPEAPHVATPPEAPPPQQQPSFEERDPGGGDGGGGGRELDAAEGGALPEAAGAGLSSALQPPQGDVPNRQAGDAARRAWGPGSEGGALGAAAEAAEEAGSLESRCELLLAQREQLQQEHGALQQEHSALQQEHGALQEEHERVAGELRDELRYEKEKRLALELEVAALQSRLEKMRQSHEEDLRRERAALEVLRAHLSEVMVHHAEATREPSETSLAAGSRRSMGGLASTSSAYTGISRDLDVRELGQAAAPVPGNSSRLAVLSKAAADANEKLLLEASKLGRIDVVKQTLADPLADRDYKPHGLGAGSNETPLYVAVCGEYSDVVNELLESGAAPDEPATDGITSLYAAAERGNLRIVQLLLAKGARPDLQISSQGKNTALHIASKHGHIAVVGELLHALLTKEIPHGVNAREETALHFAAEKGHVEVATALVEAGVSLNAQRSDGQTALHRACRKGHLDMVKFLFRSGAHLLYDKPNPAALRFRGRTAICAAKETGNKEIERYLTEGRRD